MLVVSEPAIMASSPFATASVRLNFEGSSLPSLLLTISNSYQILINILTNISYQIVKQILILWSSGVALFSTLNCEPSKFDDLVRYEWKPKKKASSPRNVLLPCRATVFTEEPLLGRRILRHDWSYSILSIINPIIPSLSPSLINSNAPPKLPRIRGF